MSPRLRIVILALTFLLGLMVSLGTVLLLTPGQNSSVKVQQSSVGGAFSLVDHNGSRVTDQSFSGGPFLVFFGFTHCPEICPTALFEMSEILRALGGDTGAINALFITIDPERDTAEKLKDYLQSFDPRLKGLTGSVAEIEQVAKAYRAYYKKVPLPDGDYTMDHSTIVYLMNKDGQFVAPFNIKRPPEQAAADLRPYL